jgi:hypothetical protein
MPFTLAVRRSGARSRDALLSMASPALHASLAVLAALSLLAACGGSSEPSSPGGFDAPPERPPGSTAPTDPLRPEPSPTDGGAPEGGDEVVPASAFVAGPLIGTPARGELLPLFGRGEGEPVLTSNNPEAFTGDGTLYTNARALPARGGKATRLPRTDGGSFGVYLHHLNQSGKVSFVTLLITNPGGAAVDVSLAGTGYSQEETGGVGLGSSPDYRVSRDWITGQRTATATARVESGKGAVLWSKRVAQNHEVDGRFTLTASAAVNVYVVAAPDASATAALTLTQPIREAPGDYRESGSPAPPFGRAAGVYAHDTWRSAFDAELPDGVKHVAFMVNTATGGGLPQVQAFPALARLDKSAAEAVGMYGNVYDVDVGLLNRGTAARRVRVAFHSLSKGSVSRWWDGASLVDGALTNVLHVPGSETTTLFDGEVLPGQRRVRFRAMVPGLASIPQALSIETLD